MPLLICVGQLHRFLARLTETSHALNGRTVLYLPRGDMSDPVTAAADKVHKHAIVFGSGLEQRFSCRLLKLRLAHLAAGLGTAP